MKEIVLFLGLPGSGKTFQADKLVEHQGFVKLSFANELRECLWDLLGWKPSYQEEYSQFKSKTLFLIGDKLVNGRFLLQRLGTEVIRKRMPDFWVKELLKNVKINNYEKIVIDDCRFANEILFILNFALGEKYKVTIKYCEYKSSIFNSFICCNYENQHESEKISFRLYNSKKFTDLETLYSNDQIHPLPKELF